MTRILNGEGNYDDTDLERRNSRIAQRWFAWYRTTSRE